jgi:hypothetical protein
MFFEQQIESFLFGKIFSRISRISRIRNPSLLLIRAIREIRGCILNPNGLIHNHFQRIHPLGPLASATAAAVCSNGSARVTSLRTSSRQEDTSRATSLLHYFFPA